MGVPAQNSTNYWCNYKGGLPKLRCFVSRNMTMMDYREIFNISKFIINWKIRKTVQATNLPLEISMELTNVCNFKCKFCPQADPNHLDILGKTYLDSENARKILKEIRAFGYKRSALHLALDGEPFMNKQFAEISALASDFGFTNQFFATNGVLLNKDKLSGLSKDVKYTFTIDYCEDREYFENVRGTKGSWSRTYANIMRILENEAFSNMHVYITDISSYSLTDKHELDKRFRDLQNLFPKSRRIKFARKTFHNATGTVRRHGWKKSKKYNLCPYPWSSMMIASNGDVVVCCRDLRHKTILGNVFQQSLTEIWNGEIYRNVRQRLLERKPCDIEACKGCDLPYDKSKFSMSNIWVTVMNRLQFTE